MKTIKDKRRVSEVFESLLTPETKKQSRMKPILNRVHRKIHEYHGATLPQLGGRPPRLVKVHVCKEGPITKRQAYNRLKRRRLLDLPWEKCDEANDLWFSQFMKKHKLMLELRKTRSHREHWLLMARVKVKILIDFDLFAKYFNDFTKPTHLIV